MYEANSKPVKQFSIAGVFMYEHVSVSAASRHISKLLQKKCHHAPIGNVCNGVGNTAYGYKWEFTNHEHIR